MKLVGGIVKLVALLGGALVTFVGLAALAGSVVSSGWGRAGIALGVGLLVPLIVAEIALARFAPDKRRGVTSDVLAVMYVGFALVFVGLMHAPSRPLLQKEGDRLAHAGWNRTAKLAWALAASLVALQFGATVADGWRLERERRALEAEREAVFRAAFPEAKTIVDPALQMRRNLADLQRSRGRAAANDFLSLATAAARADGAPAKRLVYASGRLEVDRAEARK